MAEDKKKKMLERVRALVAKAQRSEFPEERDAFLAKADAIMTAYAISEWEVAQAQDSKDRPKPEARDFNVALRDAHDAVEWETRQAWYDAMAQLVKWCRVVVVGPKIVGFSADLDYFEMLYTTILLEMVSRLDPHYDPDKSLAENVAALKEAGLKWDRIHKILVNASAAEDRPFTRSVGLNYYRAYSKWCAEVGREQVTISPTVYRRSFYLGFAEEIEQRVRSMIFDRDHRERADAKVGRAFVAGSSGPAEAPASTSVAIERVMTDRNDEIMEFIYETGLRKRPHPQGCDCDTHHYCWDPACERGCVASRERQAKESRRRPRAEPPPLRVNREAKRRGESQARNVDLSGGRNRVGRSERPSLGDGEA